MDLAEFFSKIDLDPVMMLKVIIEADVPYVILFKDRESRIQYVNEKFYLKHKEFAGNKDSVIGKTDFDLFPNTTSNHAKDAYEDEQRVMETGVPIDLIESEGKDEFGRFIIAHTRKYPVYNNKKEIIGIFVITEDVSNDLWVIKENQEKADLLSKLNKQLTKENTTDSLSGLYNRRFIRAQLDSLLDTFRETNVAFSVAIVDLDGFKDINDSYGHGVGDNVISYVGQMLEAIRHQTPIQYLPCRYGGDEFLIIMPEAKKEESIQTLRQIKDTFDTNPYIDESITLTIPASIGIATVKKEDNIRSLLERCDKRLYESKKNGKNRITY